VALVLSGGQGLPRAFACLYKSKTGVWGNVISTAITTDGWIYSNRPGVLVGNASCWLLTGVPRGSILRFDFDRQRLDVVERPGDGYIPNISFQITRTGESSLGLIILTQLRMQLWERMLDSDDVARWVLKKTIELGKHLLPRSPIKDTWMAIKGYDEDHNVIFLHTSIGSLFMIQLDSMRFKETPRSKFSTTYFPYASFYAVGNSLSLHCKSNYRKTPNYCTFTLSLY
jgi:hypothetical protein